MSNNNFGQGLNNNLNVLLDNSGLDVSGNMKLSNRAAAMNSGKASYEFASSSAAMQMGGGAMVDLNASRSYEQSAALMGMGGGMNTSSYAAAMGAGGAMMGMGGGMALNSSFQGGYLATGAGAMGMTGAAVGGYTIQEGNLATDGVDVLANAQEIRIRLGGDEVELEIEALDKILNEEQQEQVSFAESEYHRVETENLSKINVKKLEIKAQKEQINIKIKKIQSDLAAFIAQQQSNIQATNTKINTANARTSSTHEHIEIHQKENQEKYQTQKARIDQMNEQIWRTTSDFDIQIAKFERQLVDIQENGVNAVEQVTDTFQKVNKLGSELKEMQNKQVEMQNDLFDKDEDLRQLDDEVSSIQANARTAVTEEMQNDITEKREKAEVDAKAHVEQWINSYRVSLQHQFQIAYDQRVAQIEMAYQQQKMVLVQKQEEIATLAKTHYMNYIRKVEQDIDMEINVKIKQYIESNHSQILLKHKVKTEEINSIKREIDAVTKLMSDSEITIQTHESSGNKEESAKKMAAQLQAQIDMAIKTRDLQVVTLRQSLEMLEDDFKRMKPVKEIHEIIGSGKEKSVYDETSGKIEGYKAEIKDFMASIVQKREKYSKKEKKQMEELALLDEEIVIFERSLRTEIAKMQAEVIRIRTECYQYNARIRRQKLIEKQQAEKAIVVETMYTDIKTRELNQAQIEAQMRQKIQIVTDLIWTEFDTDNDGKLNYKETELFAKRFAEKYNITGLFKGQSFEQFFYQYDKNHDDYISRVEIRDFVEDMLKVQDKIWEQIKAELGVEENSDAEEEMIQTQTYAKEYMKDMKGGVKTIKAQTLEQSNVVYGQSSTVGTALTAGAGASSSFNQKSSTVGTALTAGAGASSSYNQKSSTVGTALTAGAGMTYKTSTVGQAAYGGMKSGMAIKTGDDSSSDDQAFDPKKAENVADYTSSDEE